MSEKKSRKNLRKLKRKKPAFLNVGRSLHGHGLRSWRRPRGIDSKQRVKVQSQPNMPTIGYGSPKAIKGLHPSGLVPVVFHNARELEEIPEERRSEIIVYIGHGVGKRKRASLLEKAAELGIRIANVGVG